MLIGELAKRSGVSRDTIRYYEKLKLLVVKHRHADNDYKIYSDNSLDRLRQIQRLKVVGFTLREVGQLLTQDAEQHPCEGLPLLLAQKLETIDKQLVMLQSYKASILSVKNRCDGDCETFKGLPTCCAPPKSAVPSAQCC